MCNLKAKLSISKKKSAFSLADKKESSTFALDFKRHMTSDNARKTMRQAQRISDSKVITFGTVAQLNRASDYGSEGSGFESLRCHKRETCLGKSLFLFVIAPVMAGLGEREWRYWWRSPAFSITLLV